jgi:hypothetical protein
MEERDTRAAVQLAKIATAGQTAVSHAGHIIR